MVFLVNQLEASCFLKENAYLTDNCNTLSQNCWSSIILCSYGTIHIFIDRTFNLPRPLLTPAVRQFQAAIPYILSNIPLQGHPVQSQEQFLAPRRPGWFCFAVLLL